MKLLERNGDDAEDWLSSSTVVRTFRRRLLSASKRRFQLFLFFAFCLLTYVWNAHQIKAKTEFKSKMQMQRIQDASGRFGGDIATACIKAIDHLRALDLKLLALDFDLTIVDLHTGGSWQEDADSLSHHLRPEMVCLIQEAIQSGIFFAVTSFSQQIDLIREVITDGIIAKSKTKAPPTISIQGGTNYSDPKGKKIQLEKAITEILELEGTRGITPRKTLLIDDDKNNIRLARRDGYQSLWFDPDHPLSTLHTMLELTRDHLK